MYKNIIKVPLSNVLLLPGWYLYIYCYLSCVVKFGRASRKSVQLLQISDVIAYIQTLLLVMYGIQLSYMFLFLHSSEKKPLSKCDNDREARNETEIRNWEIVLVTLISLLVINGSIKFSKVIGSRMKLLSKNAQMQ